MLRCALQATALRKLARGACSGKQLPFLKRTPSHKPPPSITEEPTGSDDDIQDGTHGGGREEAAGGSDLAGGDGLEPQVTHEELRYTNGDVYRVS